MKDQRAIKGKLYQNGIRPNWSLILGREKCEKEERRREEEEKEKKKKRRKVWICDFEHGN